MNTLTNLIPENLDRGSHTSPDDGMCFLEAVAAVTGEPHTDNPNCVSPVLARYGRTLNDSIRTQTLRNKLLLPLIPDMVGTVYSSYESGRRQFLTDWIMQKLLPDVLRTCGQVALAKSFANTTETAAIVKIAKDASRRPPDLTTAGILLAIARHFPHNNCFGCALSIMRPLSLIHAPDKSRKQAEAEFHTTATEGLIKAISLPLRENNA